MAADETGFQGGDGSAPLPMAYFMAGLTSCLMTQLRAFAKKMRIDIQNAVVNCHAEWDATIEGRDPYVAAPRGVRMDIEFDSDAPVAERLRLIEAAKKGCFIEAIVREHFDLTPAGIIRDLDLLKPIYRATAAHGHFGREPGEGGEGTFTWERTDKAAALKSAASAAAATS